MSKTKSKDKKSKVPRSRGEKKLIKFFVIAIFSIAILGVVLSVISSFDII